MYLSHVFRKVSLIRHLSPLLTFFFCFLKSKQSIYSSMPFTKNKLFKQVWILFSSENPHNFGSISENIRHTSILSHVYIFVLNLIQAISQIFENIINSPATRKISSTYILGISDGLTSKGGYMYCPFANCERICRLATPTSLANLK